MIAPKAFVEQLQAAGVDFFTGVPDSLLKNLCAYITDYCDKNNHIIAANEGGAVGLAAGYHLATGKIGCVYMQNSGEGNVVNPLLSLADKDVYQIPMLLIIGWRGEPGVKDEPQHVKQGKVTLALLETMGIPYAVLDEHWKVQVAEALEYIKEQQGIYALVIRKGTFEEYTLQRVENDESTLSREEAIQAVGTHLKQDDVVVSTTGMISRELYEYRDALFQGHQADFLTVGSMGHASQIALSIALQHPERRVFIFDGDGAMLMHMGSMAIIGDYCLPNLVHIVFNNGAHDSVGGQPTVANRINLNLIAEAVGYAYTTTVDTVKGIDDAFEKLNAQDRQGTAFIHIKVRKGHRSDLGRPKTTPIENKEAFMRNLGL